VRDPKVAGLKKNSAAVQKYLEELVKIGKDSITLCHVSILKYPDNNICLSYIFIVFCLIYQIFAGKIFGFLSCPIFLYACYISSL